MLELLKLILLMKKCKKEKLKETLIFKAIKLKLKTCKKLGNLNLQFIKLKMQRKLLQFTSIKQNKSAFVQVTTVSRMVLTQEIILYLVALKE